MSNIYILNKVIPLNVGMFSIVLFVVLCISAQAQDTIRLVNPSLEDKPTCCKAPQGWTSLDFPGMTPPDVQPGGGFSVNNQPYDGNTYLAMVTRYDGTFETIYQKLSSPLLADKCYVISVFLAVSAEYLSATRENPNKPISFTQPAILQILGGNDPKDPELEILNASTPVEHLDWIEYIFEFVPSEDFSYIFLSAYFPEGTEYFTNGHILVDYLSHIVTCEDIID